MKIGTEKISKEQARILEQARRGSAPTVIEALYRIARDGDVRAEREDVHPDWIGVFESNRELLERSLSDEPRKAIEEFFGELTTTDQELLHLDPNKLRTAFLLGAGASKPDPSNIPTVKELLPQLLERGRRLDREDVAKLAAFCEERSIDNIEDLLTAAQLATFSSRNPTILRLLNYLLYGGGGDDSREESYYPVQQMEFFERPRRIRRQDAAAANVSSVAFLQDTLQVLFGLLASTMLPAEPNKAHEAIARFTKAHPESAVVTTNYDCCMDLALEAMQLPLTYRLDFANRGKEEDTGRTRLVKLHGSLNWYYCETCQEVQCVDIRSTVDNYKQDKAPYSVIAICKDCGGQRRGLLVPPLAMKFDVAPPLTPLITEAMDAFEAAETIVVVGFSFADADVYIARMLSKSMQTKPSQKLIIIDPSPEVAGRVRRKFKASIPNFDERRIIRITEDCSEAVPKLLSGAYLQLPDVSKGEPVKERRASAD